MTTPPHAEDQLGFLRAHSQAVLATGRRDGSPQLSTVVYAVDGAHVLVSTKRNTAQVRNAARRPRVALAVNDGHAQLVIYGHAETIEHDPQRAELTATIWAAMTGETVPDPATPIPALDEQQRTVIRVTADHVLFNP